MIANFIYFYQHIPYHLNPIIFSWGSFSLDWYSLMYLVGFLTVYLLLRYRIKKGEFLEEKQDISNKIERQKQLFKILTDFMLVGFLGLILGGRLGYVIFYNFSYYWAHPLAIISPFDPITHQFIGIYGMSYHGGLVGVLVSTGILAKMRQINFLKWANFIAPAVPAGYFFGRLGNFINGELYGRVTQRVWGMYFPTDFTHQLRHPSQLYEALLEGGLLFLVLWKVRNRKKIKDKTAGLYILGYAILRIIVEFFRQPDEQLGLVGGILTMGQWLSLAMLILGLVFIFALGQKNKKML